MKKLTSILLSIVLILTMAAPAFAGTQASKPPAVQELHILKAGYRSLKLSWQSVPGTEKYEIYRSLSGNTKTFKRQAIAKTTNYTNTGLTCGKTYYYKVRAVGFDGKGKFSEVMHSKVQPSRVEITGIKALKTYKNRVYWQPVSGATGYQIYRKRTDQSSWNLFKTVPKKYTYCTDNLKIGEEKYDWEYKVRAYRLVKGKKVYGYFSTSAEYEQDWNISELYEEIWKYGESLTFPMYEATEDMQENGKYYRPKSDGSTYHMKHVIGFDEETYASVYTNTANGSTQKPAKFVENTPENCSYNVGWPIQIDKYTPKKEILKMVKACLADDFNSTAKLCPLYWDPEWQTWAGDDEFTIYIEKTKDGYAIWSLY